MTDDFKPQLRALSAEKREAPVWTGRYARTVPVSFIFIIIVLLLLLIAAVVIIVIAFVSVFLYPLLNSM